MNRKDRKSVGLVGGPNQYITDISEFVSIEGYKRNSPDVNNPYNIIESGNITMEDVDFPVYGRDNLGNEQIMEAGGGNYQFPGDSVLEIPMAQYAGEIPSPMEDPNGFLYQIEDLIGYHLDYPNGKGETFATMPGEENSIDNLRHAGSARYTAEAIAQKIKDVPYIGGLLDFVGVDKAAGFIGANALGLGHELTSFFGEDERSFLTKIKEMGEDSFNNLIGSVIGSTDMDSDKKDQLLKKLSFNNILPDGYVSTKNGIKNGLSENIYFKDKEGKVKAPEYKRGGGLLNKTMKCNSCGWSWKAADGGADVSTCHKCGSSALPKAQGGNKGIKVDDDVVQNSFQRQWLDSPMYEQILANEVSATEDPDFITFARKSNLDNIDLNLIDDVKEDSEGTSATSHGIDGRITLYKPSQEGLDKGHVHENTLEHEIGHSSDRVGPDTMAKYFLSLSLKDRAALANFTGSFTPSVVGLANAGYNFFTNQLIYSTKERQQANIP